MKIEINNETSFRIKKKLLKKIILTASSFLRLSQDAEISVAFVSASIIKSLNKKYRQKNKVTTILSFPYLDYQKTRGLKSLSGFLGELVVCPKEIKRQAKKKVSPPDRMLAFCLVHGLLHLIGIHHKTFRQEKSGKMLERKILTKIFGKNNFYAVR